MFYKGSLRLHWEPQPVTGGTTLVVTVSFISKIACCIHETCDKKKLPKIIII